MAYFQSIFLRILCLSVLCLLPSLMWGQTGTEPRQVEAVDTLTTGVSLPSYERWVMVSELDTLGIDDYRYHHNRLALNHLFFKEDSLCFSLIHQEDTTCVPIDSMGCFTVIYGMGDSTRVVCPGDTMYITFPEPSVGGGDTTYYWVYKTNGGAPDTVIMAEIINFVNQENITITQGSTDLIFKVPYPNDSYADSAGVWSNDTVWVYRKDTTGIIDSFPAVIPLASLNDTIYQSFSIDTTTALFTLSDDPTASPDLLVLPWKDAIRDDFSANYTDSIRHEGYVGIQTVPSYPLDIKMAQSTSIAQRIYGTSGSYAIRYQDSSFSDQGYFDQGMISGGFLLKQKDGGSGRIVMEVDSGASERALRLIGPSENNGVQMQDYGVGNYLDTIAYLTGWKADGKLLEVPFLDLQDSIDTYIDSIRYDDANDTLYLYRYLSGGIVDTLKAEIITFNDTILDADWYVLGTTDVPYDIDDHIYSGTTTSKRVRIGQDSLENGFNLLINSGAGGIEVKSSIPNKIRTRNRTTNEYWDLTRQSGEFLISNGNLDEGRYGNYIWMYNGHDSTNALMYMDSAKITFTTDTMIFDKYPYTRIDGTIDSVKALYYPDTNGYMYVMPIDSLKRVFGDYDFVRLHDDSTYYSSTQRDSLLPLTEQSLDSTVWRAGRIRIADTAYVKQYDESVNQLLNLDNAYVQVIGRFNTFDTYQQDSVTSWSRIKKADHWERITNHGNEIDSIATWREWGASSRYSPDGAGFQSDSRTFFKVSGQANQGAFVLHQDSLQLADYTSDREDTLVTVADITKMFVPKANGVLALVSLDTINAALSLATAEIDLLYWGFKEDSLGILWTGLADTGFVDLSKYNVSITGDSIYQGDTVFALPQGADSLGTTHTANEVIVAGGGRKAISYNTFTALTNTLTMPGDIQTGNNVSTGNALVRVGYHRTGDGGSLLDLHSTSSGIFSTRMLRVAGADGGFNFQNSGVGNLNFNINGNNLSLVVRGADGGISFPNYTTGTSFAGADVGVLGYASNGAVQGMDAADLKTFIGANDATNIANTHVAYSNGTNLIGSSNMTFDGTNFNILGSGDIHIGAPPIGYEAFPLTVNDANGGIILQRTAADAFIRIINASTALGGQVRNTPTGQLSGIRITDLNASSVGLVAASNNVGIGTYPSTSYALWISGATRFSGHIYDINAFTGNVGEVLTRGGSGPDWEPLPDGSSSNEINVISLGTKVGGSVPIQLSNGGGSINLVQGSNITLTPSGTNLTIAAAAGGGGIYGGSGSLPTSTNVIAAIPSSSSFVLDYNGGSDEFAITSSSTHLATYASNGNLTLVSQSGDVVMTAGNGTNDDVIITGYDHVDIDATTGEVLIEALSIVNSAITSTSLAFTATSTDIQFTAGTNIALQAGGTNYVQLSGGTAGVDIGSSGSTNITDDAFIGGNTSDQLRIATTSSSVTIGHETATSSNITFDQSTTNNGRVNINSATNGNSDIRLTCSSNIETSQPVAIGSLFPSSTPSHMLYVTGTAFLSTGTLWTTSDERIKKDITTITNPYAKILSLRPVTYKYREDYIKDQNMKDRLKVGYVAQEYGKVFPQDVSNDGPQYHGETMYNLAPEAVGPYTTAAVQQLIKDKQQLESTVNDMRAVITSQEDRILKLEKAVAKLIK